MFLDMQISIPFSEISDGKKREIVDARRFFQYLSETNDFSNPSIFQTGFYQIVFEKYLNACGIVDIHDKHCWREFVELFATLADNIELIIKDLKREKILAEISEFKGNAITLNVIDSKRFADWINNRKPAVPKTPDSQPISQKRKRSVAQIPADLLTEFEQRDPAVMDLQNPPPNNNFLASGHVSQVSTNSLFSQWRIPRNNDQTFTNSRVSNARDTIVNFLRKFIEVIYTEGLTSDSINQLKKQIGDAKADLLIIREYCDGWRLNAEKCLLALFEEMIKCAGAIAIFNLFPRIQHELVGATVLSTPQNSFRSSSDLIRAAAAVARNVTKDVLEIIPQAREVITNLLISLSVSDCAATLHTKLDEALNALVIIINDPRYDKQKNLISLTELFTIMLQIADNYFKEIELQLRLPSMEGSSSQSSEDPAIEYEGEEPEDEPEDIKKHGYN